jgi:small-conductance mechanosensitive channel
MAFIVNSDLTYFLTLLGLIGGSVVFGKIIGPVLIRIAGHFTAKTKTTIDDRIFAAVKGPLESSFFLVFLYIGIHNITALETAIPFSEKYISFAFTILLMILGFRVTKEVYHWYLEEGHKTSKIKIEPSVLPLLRKVAEMGILFLGVGIALMEIGFDVTGLLAITSVVSLILGLASQETLANIFAGLALQIDRSHHYGDIYKLPTGEWARLRKIGMRTTRLDDSSGGYILLSNSEFAKLRVLCVGKDEHMKLKIPFEAPASTDFDKIVDAVSKALDAAPHEWELDKKTIKVRMSKTLYLGGIEGSVTFHIHGVTHVTDATHQVMRCIADVITKSKAR